jgi:hypothetical protein
VKRRTLTYETTYFEFEPGEKIIATSPRSPLEQGKVYTVREFHPPRIYGDEPIIFLEGRRTGITSEYVTKYIPEGTPTIRIMKSDHRFMCWVCNLDTAGDEWIVDLTSNLWVPMKECVTAKTYPTEETALFVAEYLIEGKGIKKWEVTYT